MKKKSLSTIIKKPIEDIKFYLPILVILPAILGGIWQLIELLKIDPSFIRFFSATQLLPDGILMLMVVITTVPLFLIIYILDVNIFINDDKITVIPPPSHKHFYILKNKQRKINYKSYCKDVLPLGSLFTLTLITVMLFGYLIIKIEETSLLTLLIRLFFSFFFLAFTIYAYGERWRCSNNRIINKIKNNRYFIYFFTFLHTIIVTIIKFIILVLIPLFIVLSIHNEYLFPNNLENVKNIDQNIKGKTYKSSKLLYLNDKYIFLEHIDQNESKSIEIMKFDTLFDE